MEQTAWQDGNGRRVIRREWYNARGQLHRTTGPAEEHWTVLPGGAHMLSYQVWSLNGRIHREGRPAWRSWRVADDGTRVLVREGWFQYEQSHHRSTGPAYRRWTVGQDGTRTLAWEEWCVNEKLHRADGPAQDGRSFYWHGVEVRQEALPWLRRGQGILAGLADGHGAEPQGDGAAASSPAWSGDTRVTVTWHGEGAVVAAYRSAVGGSMLLCV